MFLLTVAEIKLPKNGMTKLYENIYCFLKAQKIKISIKIEMLLEKRAKIKESLKGFS
jgi:hypothetical protein